VSLISTLTSSSNTEVKITPIFTKNKFPSKLNRISTSKYTIITFIPKFLKEQFSHLANCYFLFISFIQFIPDVSTIGKYTTILPLTAVLTVAAIKELYWDQKRRKEDNRTNNKTCLVWRKSRTDEIYKQTSSDELDVSSRECFDGATGWQRIKWKDVNQGDIVKVLEDETFPCDMVFISSTEPESVCYVETANLDGETNLKMKQANYKLQAHFATKNGIFCDKIPDSSIGADFTVEKSNDKLYVFNANVSLPKNSSLPPSLQIDGLREEVPLSINDLLLRGTVLKNSKAVTGIATYIGHNSKIYMNNARPPIKITNVNRRLNYQIGFLFILIIVIAVSCCFGTMMNRKKISSHWYLGQDFGGTSQSANHHSRHFTNSTDEIQFNTFDTVSSAFWQVLTFMVLFNTFIPISLLVSLDFNKLVLASFINNDIDMYDAERDIWSCCKTSNLVEELGQVKYIFTDKTGTLTRNIMEFKLASIKQKDNCVQTFNVEEDEISTESDTDFFRAVSLCHTAIAVQDGENNYKYKAASPDEEALVGGASKLGIVFTHKSPTVMTMFDKFQDKTFTYDVLATLEFSSARQCMSIILREKFGAKRIIMYSKGSDVVIMSKIKNTDSKTESLINSTNKRLFQFASNGLRTLVFGTKILTETEFADWHHSFKKAQALLVNRDQEVDKWSQTIEEGLTLLGASAIEDRLQDRVPETIENLRRSGIHIWMLTGDKVETAINIAYSARLLSRVSGLILVDEELEKLKKYEKSGNKLSDSPMKVMLDNIKEQFRMMSGDKSPSIVVSGFTLELLLASKYVDQFLKLALKCNTVICARVTPSQKAAVTKRVKIFVGPNCVTLAIGDGANDVPMIQSASLGIGISGQEGLQAANNSDYAIPQFKFLEKLLLVHGSWNYHRITRCILYFFYKNSSLHLQQLWFAPFNLYSGTNMFENWHLAFYNAAFLLYPPMAIAIFERPYPKKYLLQVPKVYQLGQEGQKYNVKLFVYYIINSIYHSLFLFFLVSTTLLKDNQNDGRSIGLEMVGHIVYACTMVLCIFKCQTEVTGLTAMHVFLTYIGVFLWFAFHAIYSKLLYFGVVFKGSVRMAEMASNTFSSNIFWLCVLVFPATVAIPDFLWKTWKNAIFNSDKMTEGCHLKSSTRISRMTTVSENVKEFKKE
jgi:phospholipid-transporting ATPase